MGKSKQPRTKHIPQRTCVACRQKRDKRSLTRIVRTADDGIVIDSTGKRNGRGAYLCDQPSCWDKALSDIRLLNRALMAEIGEAELAMIAAHKPMSSQLA